MDLILGVTWLKSLGKMLMDWRMMSLSFHWQDNQVTLYGLRPKGVAMQNSKEKLLQEITLFSVTTYSPMMIDGCLWKSNVEVTTVQGSELSLEKVLLDHPEVFTERLGIPPGRAIEHSITFQEATAPISVQPYRYPHYQKNEIERQVQEMLSQGIIRPSFCPFSSPVILVKKKDESWRCV